MKKSTLAILAAVVVVIVVAAVVVVYLIPRAIPAILVVGTTEREETFDPADAYNYFSVNMLQNTMSTLLTYDPSGDGSLDPMLLTEVPTTANGGISTDQLTYTLHLRTGATFEDGTSIDADVVKYSLDRYLKAKVDPVTNETRVPVPSFLLDPLRGASAYITAFTAWAVEPNNSPNKTTLATARDAAWTAYSTGANAAVEVVNPTTIRVHMGRVWSPFPQLLAFTGTTPVNPDVFLMDAFKPTTIHSSGPYRLTTFVAGERAELDTNPRFFGTAPGTSKVVIKFYADSAGLALAMDRGEIDVAYRNLDPADYERFAVDPTLRAAQGSSSVIRYIVFNNQTTEFSNVNIRRALAYAADRTRITQTVFLNSTEPLYSLIPRGMFGHTDVFQTRYARNIAAAQALLQAEGYSTTNKLAFTLWYTPARYGTTEADVAALVKQAWEETGMVSVTLNSQEWSTYRVSFRSSAFSVFLLGWFPDYLDPDNYVFPFLHSASGGTASFGSWYTNTTLDQLIELQAAQDVQSTERAQTLSDIQDALADDVPYLPMWQTTQQVVYKPSVSGIVLDNSQFFRYFTIRIG